MELTPAKPSKRLISYLIDLAFVFFLALFLDKVAISPIAKSSFGYEATYSKYEALNEEWESLKVKYGIVLVDSSSQSHSNTSLLPSQEEAFFADERVIFIQDEAPKLQNQLLVMDWAIVGLDAFFSSFLYFIFLPIILPQGKSLGLLLMGYGVYDLKKGAMLKRRRAWPRALLNYLFFGLLGIGTFFLVPLILYFFLCYSSSSQDLVDRITSTKVVEDKGKKKA